MADTKRIQLLYSIGDFNDALYFTEEEWENITDQEIDNMKNARYDAYQEQILNPPAPPVPTTEELERYAQELQSELQKVQEQLESNA